MRRLPSGLLVLAAAVGCRAARLAPAAPILAPPAAAQNPSPMAETSRAHERLAVKELNGVKRSFVGPAGKPVEVLVPDRARTRDAIDLVVHFHGAAWLPEQAVAALDDHTVTAVVNLGVGSGAYHSA